jgi:UDP-N-acetylmuramoylalanine--D-glutamate ligase
MAIINNKIAIFGLARSGVSLKNFLQKKTNADIYLFDDNLDQINKFRNETKIIICDPLDAKWDEVDYLVVSPGVDINKNNNVIDNAKKFGVTITVDIELFYFFLKAQNQNAKLICISGTNGKSTTTAMVGHIMKNACLNVQIGGNIGIPVFDLDFDSDFYVLEISSYQLDLLDKTNFDIGVLLNITPDHLDRYNFKLENYINSKKKIFKISKKIVFGIDSEITCEIYCNDELENIVTISAGVREADFICEEIVIKNNLNNAININNVHSLEGIDQLGNSQSSNNFNVIFHTALEKRYSSKKMNELKGPCIKSYDEKHKVQYENKALIPFQSNLIGSHNRENICAAFAICSLLNIKNSDIANGIGSFNGLSHRLEFVCDYNGDRFSPLGSLARDNSFSLNLSSLEDFISAGVFLKNAYLLNNFNINNNIENNGLHNFVDDEDVVLNEKYSDALCDKVIKNTISFINDSKATTGNATVSAIKAFDHKDEIYLIVGGVQKSDGLMPLVDYLDRIKKFYLIGKSSESFGDLLKQNNCAAGLKFEFCEKLEFACKKALEDSLKSNYNGRKVILFSPACSSFDQFRDFEDRGEQFVNIVKNIVL